MTKPVQNVRTERAIDDAYQYLSTTYTAGNPTRSTTPVRRSHGLRRFGFFTFGFASFEGSGGVNGENCWVCRFRLKTFLGFRHTLEAIWVFEGRGLL
jgi:hypothetical protein